MGRRVPDSRFATIDALRGVAAIAVMVYHAGPASPVAMPGGYLAVDLFFALSGFVIAHSYAERLDGGMAFGAFMWRRVARLWPMLALGALLGIALHGGHAGMLFLLPNPKSPTMLFPANPPLWSLLFEMLAYAAFALVWRCWGMAAIAPITALSAAALLHLAGSDHAVEGFGAEWPALLAGGARLGFAFGIGVCLARSGLAQVRRVTPLAWLVPAAFAALAMALPPGNTWATGFILLGVPALSFAAIRWEMPQVRLGRMLGDLSYPLYCIHVPLLGMLTGMTATTMALFVMPAAALWLDRSVDARARTALLRLLTGPRLLAAGERGA